MRNQIKKKLEEKNGKSRACNFLLLAPIEVVLNLSTVFSRYRLLCGKGNVKFKWESINH